jgi:hypothetical protein
MGGEDDVFVRVDCEKQRRTRRGDVIGWNLRGSRRPWAMVCVQPFTFASSFLTDSMAD